jgi:hypothetical protein
MMMPAQHLMAETVLEQMMRMKSRKERHTQDMERKGRAAACDVSCSVQVTSDWANTAFTCTQLMFHAAERSK